uniref:Uncharacterized protein n=1 Tax=Arundo donax TaxID=35708 RepID=A0A0A9ETY7_ARUDO
MSLSWALNPWWCPVSIWTWPPASPSVPSTTPTPSGTPSSSGSVYTGHHDANQRKFLCLSEFINCTRMLSWYSC